MFKRDIIEMCEKKSIFDTSFSAEHKQFIEFKRNALENNKKYECSKWILE